MMKGFIISGLVLGCLLIAAAGLVLVPNSLGQGLISQAKARGYLAYTPEEATELAYRRCTTCHSDEKILLYCARCGPPFIVVTHFMKKYVEVTNMQVGAKAVAQFTDAELAAITQVWNGLVGNWEDDWPARDIKKLLGNDKALIRLFETPPDKRLIEAVLKHKTAPGSYKEIQG